MFSIGVILVFVLLLYNFLIYPRIDQTTSLQRTNAAKSICSDLSNVINTVAYNGNGFSQKVSFPALLSGVKYNITVMQSMIEVNWSKNSVYCQIRARNISYAGKYPPLNLTRTEYLLNNSDGVVKIA